MQWPKTLIFMCIVQVIRCNQNCTGKILLDRFHLDDRKIIEIPVNSPLTIECQLDERAIQSECVTSKLAYTFGDNTSATDVELFNNSLMLKVNTARPTQLTVDCTYDGSVFTKDVIDIHIGFSPLPINLNCLMHMEHLICDFNISINPIVETITVELENTTSAGFYQSVPFEKNITNRIDVQGDFYGLDRINFRVLVNNSIGPPLLDHFIFKTQEITCLERITPIKLKNLTADKLTVSWSLSNIHNKYLQTYEFKHNMTLKTNPKCSKNDPISFDFEPTRTIKTNNSITFERDLNLTCANIQYTIIINTCVKNAHNWIEQFTKASIILISPKRVPNTPPRTMPDAFEYIENTNDVKVYWKRTPSELESGSNYTIKLQGILENGIKKKFRAKFSITSVTIYNLDPTNVYEIRLTSQNSEGTSTVFSTVVIPKKEDLMEPPQNLQNVVNGIYYNLSWTTATPVDNYTIFWCTRLDEQGSKCQELLNTKTIFGNRTTFVFNNTVGIASMYSKIFAISSNWNGQTSGMKWFTCHTSIHSEMAKIEHPQIIAINSTAIKLKWAVPCKTKPFVTSATIDYCEVTQIDKIEMCATYIRHPINIAAEVVITTLKPYTDYVFKLALFDGVNFGPLNQITYQTEVGVPDPPTNIKYGIITNTSVEIYWTPPTNWRGPPQIYNVSYATKFGPHSQYVNLSNFTILKNLHSYTKYKVSIGACHKLCSNFSDVIDIETKIGKPGKITGLEINDNYEWLPPIEKTSKFHLYEIRFEIPLKNSQIVTSYSLTMVSKCTLVRKMCSFYTSIRTINLDKEFIPNKVFNTTWNTINCREELRDLNYDELCVNYGCVAGSWEIVATGKCLTSDIPKILFFTFMTVIILAILYVIVRFGLRKYLVIRDIHVSIPFGLDIIFEKYKNPEKQSDSFRSSSRDELLPQISSSTV